MCNVSGDNHLSDNNNKLFPILHTYTSVTIQRRKRGRQPESITRTIMHFLASASNGLTCCPSTATIHKIGKLPCLSPAPRRGVFLPDRSFLNTQANGILKASAFPSSFALARSGTESRSKLGIVFVFMLGHLQLAHCDRSAAASRSRLQPSGSLGGKTRGQSFFQTPSDHEICFPV